MLLLRQHRVGSSMRVTALIIFSVVFFPYTVLTYTSSNSVVRNKRQTSLFFPLTKYRYNLYRNKDYYCDDGKTSTRPTNYIKKLQNENQQLSTTILHLFPLVSCKESSMQLSPHYVQKPCCTKMTTMKSTTTTPSQIMNRLSLSNRKSLESLDIAFEDDCNRTIVAECLNNKSSITSKIRNNKRVVRWMKQLIRSMSRISSYLFKRKESSDSNSFVLTPVRKNETKSMEDLGCNIFESEKTKEHNNYIEKKEATQLNLMNTSSSSDNVNVYDNLTGVWDLIVTNEFKQSYDKYLQLLGQPSFIRSIALSIVSYTTEVTIQRVYNTNGTELFIRTINAKGIWERTLYTSSSLFTSSFASTNRYPIRTADNELVESEAWWEKNGTIHHSWLYGIKKYGGGDFESTRYLRRTVREKEENHENGKFDRCNLNESVFLVCETTFHPIDHSREKPRIIWKFKQKTS